MNPGLKNIFNASYYVLPPLALVYVFSIIGFRNILETLFLLDVKILLLALLLKLIASACRIIKYNLVNHQQTLLDNSKLFLTARVGSELSILGHFSPMLHTKNRNMGIFSSLIIDRYLEIFSTFLIAAIFSILYIDKHWLFLYASLFLGTMLLGMVAAIIVPFNALKGLRIFKKIIDIRENIRANIKKIHYLTLNLLLLSLVASAMEFYLVVITFSGLGEHIEFGIVAVIWALSGIVSNLLLLTIGPAEITSIYLFNILSTVSASATASSLILGKAVTVLALFLIYFINLSLTYLVKQPLSPRI